MSKVSDEVQLRSGMENAPAICRQAISRLGWRVLEQSDTRYVVKEVSPQSTSFTWAAQVELVIVESSLNSGCVVHLNGAISGVGPIQKNHLKGQLGSLKNELQVAEQNVQARPPAEGTGGRGLTEELERLANLRDAGAISPEEFTQAKALLLSR